MLLDRQSADHRQAFLRWAEDLHREFSTPVPPMHIESEACIACSFAVDGGRVDLLHSLTHDPASILLECEIGSVPACTADELGLLLLRGSGELFRTRQACLGIAEERQAIVCLQWRRLSSLAATAVLAEVRALTGALRGWADANWHEEILPGIVEADMAETPRSGDGFVDWRRTFDVIVEAAGAECVRTKDRKGDDAPMVGVVLVHEGIRFSAVHSMTEPRRLTLEMPLAREGAICPPGATTDWLRLNRELARGDCAALGMTRKKDLVVFACAMELEGLDAPVLQQRMAEIAAWRGERKRAN